MSNLTPEAQADTDLFESMALGAVSVGKPHRHGSVDAQSRASVDGVPRPLMAEYYGQRSSAGLIITEGTNISLQGRGYALTPGLYTAAQIAGWQTVTEEVHAKGGRIFVQLWHVGRISHPSLQPGGALPVAPSAIRPRERPIPRQVSSPASHHGQSRRMKFPAWSNSTAKRRETLWSPVLMVSKFMRLTAI